MSGAVQVDVATEASWQATGTDGVPNLKQVAADRLAAHRQRRAMGAAAGTEAEGRTRQARETVRPAERADERRGTSVVRDVVRARYERRESYREFLAAEAERAIAQAQAEAEVAARNAKAVAETQMALLQELDTLNRPEPGPREEAIALFQSETREELAHALADIVLGARELIEEPPLLTVIESPQPAAKPITGPIHAPETATRAVSAAGLTVKLFADMPSAVGSISEARPRRGAHPADELARPSFDDEVADTLTALEEEIEFRRAPEFLSSASLETQAIPGNLIEFPRELVAPRRARPRLAEGPLREEAGGSQLRIFEVDADQPAQDHVVVQAVAAPEWQMLKLGSLQAAAPTAPSTASDAQTHLALPLDTAPVERRLMSAAVDLCCVGLAWMAATACVAEIVGPQLRAVSLPTAALFSVGTFAAFALLYQLLFFTLAEGTPGMHYARIALCTFGDGNPSRRAMRRRVFSTVLAVCPLGLGLLWAVLDHDGLGWHDRMSRMYPRAY